MKKILMAVVMLMVIGSAGVVFACSSCGCQGAKAKDHAATDHVSADVSHKKMRSDCPLEKMSKDLKLSQEQKTQFEAIMTDAMQQKEQIRQEKHSKMEALRADVKAKVAGILSDDQLKAWEAKSDKCPIMGKGKNGKHGNEGYIGGCPDCKDGKMCKKCQGKKDCMKGKCPDCKDGKICKVCKQKKGKK